MQHNEGVELSVIVLDVFANLGPVFHAHVAGVKQWIILQYTVQDTVFLIGQLASVCDPVVSVCMQRERGGGREERERETGRGGGGSEGRRKGGREKCTHCQT